MSAVLAALFPEHEIAERVRKQLVRDGFATDRVDLASLQDLGRADLVPADTIEDKLALHFQQLFPQDHNAQSVQDLSRAIIDGRAVIIVQPRGEIETRHALHILERSEPLDIRNRDLDDQRFEQAASPANSTIIPNVDKILLGPGAS